MRCGLTCSCSFFDGEDGIEGVFARHEVFRLQFFTGARRETHFEMRQAVVPRAGDVHLLGAVFGESSAMGWRFFVAAVAPNKSSGDFGTAFVGSSLCFSQTSLIRWFRQSVKRLTL